jgi:Protein of unknown function (DUF2905)
MRWLIYLGIILGGALLYSQAIAMMDLEPLPGDIIYNQGNWHINIPVLYSLGAVALTGLIFWAVKR